MLKLKTVSHYRRDTRNHDPTQTKRLTQWPSSNPATRQASWHDQLTARLSYIVFEMNTGHPEPLICWYESPQQISATYPTDYLLVPSVPLARRPQFKDLCRIFSDNIFITSGPLYLKSHKYGRLCRKWAPDVSELMEMAKARCTDTMVTFQQKGYLKVTVNSYFISQCHTRPMTIFVRQSKWLKPIRTTFCRD